MSSATILWVSVVCVCISVAAQDTAKPAFACNAKAISAADRPRYGALVKRLRAAMRHRNEISSGYAFKLDGSAITLPEVAEWISMERLCCPFLTLQVSASGNQPDWVLSLTGPAGVKPLLDAEFPAR